MRSLLLSLLAVVLLAGCEDRVGGLFGDPLGIPKYADFNSPRSAFVARKLTGGAASNALFEVRDDSVVAAVPFYDERGDLVTVDVQSSCFLGENCVAVELYYTQGGKRFYAGVVTDLDDGVLLDFSSYRLSTATLRGGILYILGDDDNVVYRTNLTTRVATPMNNSKYDSVQYVIAPFSDGNVLAYFWGPSYGLLFADNRPPLDLGLEDPFQTDSGGRASVVMMGDDGHAYSCCLSVSDDYPLIRKHTFDASGHHADVTVIESVARAPYACIGTTEYIGPTYGGRFPYRHCPIRRYNDIYWIMEDGYYHMTPLAGGGFDIIITPKAIPFLGMPMPRPDIGQVLQIGPMLYGWDGTTIRKFDVVNDTLATDIVTPANLIDWWVTGDVVFYVAYITGTNIGTYRVKPDGSVVLVESLDMQAKHIQEFNL